MEIKKLAGFAGAGVQAVNLMQKMSSFLLEDSEMHIPSPIDARVQTEATVLLWDARLSSLATAACALAHDKVLRSDHWWKNVAFQQDDERFHRDFRMSKDTFFKVCSSASWWRPQIVFLGCRF
jgi:hypothetical protein